MEVDIGYVIEAVVWEAVFISVVMLTCWKTFQHLRSTSDIGMKTFQKAWFPASFITGLLGVIMGIDLRGAFGIYRRIPRCLKIGGELMAIVPPIYAVHVWQQKFIFTTCMATAYEGPWGIGVNEKFQERMVFLLTFCWFADVILTTGLLCLYNNLRWGACLWAWGLLVGVSSYLVNHKMKSVVLEVSRSTDDKNRSFGKGPTRDSRLLQKLTWIQYVIACANSLCLMAFIYHLTFGLDQTMDSFVQADPQNYTISPILILAGLCNSTMCIGVLFITGSSTKMGSTSSSVRLLDESH
eukprot:TRINITY_DN2633_c0_g1_i1.p1 TRINITY_DN2633_c0_g1~~TRINITY_DN2633_c0_g1_i1.p1  ORF type:complete len:296 (-),score=42.30 TRINITY_DN2633_c0_g1_i1:26-913(-)